MDYFSYAERSLEKLLENFVFKFHPLRDYTMEVCIFISCIFHLKLVFLR